MARQYECFAKMYAGQLNALVGGAYHQTITYRLQVYFVTEQQLSIHSRYLDENINFHFGERTRGTQMKYTYNTWLVAT